MPEVYVHAVKGRSMEQKKALIKDITDAVVKNFSVPAEAVVIEIVEADPTLKAKGGGPVLRDAALIRATAGFFQITIVRTGERRDASALTHPP
jgi:4-oxalocrotonate tautomerase